MVSLLRSTTETPRCPARKIGIRGFICKFTYSTLNLKDEGSIYRYPGIPRLRCTFTHACKVYGRRAGALRGQPGQKLMFRRKDNCRSLITTAVQLKTVCVHSRLCVYACMCLLRVSVLFAYPQSLSARKRKVDCCSALLPHTYTRTRASRALCPAGRRLRASKSINPRWRRGIRVETRMYSVITASRGPLISASLGLY